MSNDDLLVSVFLGGVVVGTVLGMLAMFGLGTVFAW